MMDGTLNFDRKLSGVSLSDECKIRSTQCRHSVRGRTLWEASQRGRWCIFDVRCCTACNYRLVSGRLNRATVTQNSFKRFIPHSVREKWLWHVSHNHSAETRFLDPQIRIHPRFRSVLGGWCRLVVNVDKAVLTTVVNGTH